MTMTSEIQFILRARRGSSSEAGIAQSPLTTECSVSTNDFDLRREAQ
jgi:hypothetical protein